MKRISSLLAALAMGTMSLWAQADKIVGSYKAVQNGVTSKVQISKVGDGYRVQVTWVDNLVNEDGTTRTDVRNPDPAKRSVPANKIVLVDKVTYSEKDQEWKNGKIYDPTSGKVYKVVFKFKDDKTLRLRGYLGPFFETKYWTKEK